MSKEEREFFEAYGVEHFHLPPFGHFIFIIGVALTIAVVAISVLFLFLATITSCGDGCEAGEYRCNENDLEVCNSEQTWDLVFHCDEFESFSSDFSAVVICCDYDPEFESANCMLEEECNE